MTTHNIEISTATIIKVLLFGLLITFLYYIIDIITIVILAIIIASAIDQLVEFFDRFRIPRLVSVLFIYFIAVLLIALILYLVVPTLIGELKELSQVLPQYYDKSVEDFGLDPLRYAFVSNIERVVNGFGQNIGESATGIFNITTSLFSGFISLVTVVVISFYLAVREGEIEKFIELISPPKYDAYAVDLWRRVKRKFGRWLQGQLILGFIVGALVFIGLSLLGVRYSLSLALVAAVFEIIPIVGPILATVPAVLVATLESWYLGLGVLILYLVIQQLENNIIVPTVLRKIVGLNPVFVILSLLVGAKLGGVVGMFLAVPLSAALGEFIGDIQKKRITFS